MPTLDMLNPSPVISYPFIKRGNHPGALSSLGQGALSGASPAAEDTVHPMAMRILAPMHELAFHVGLSLSGATMVVIACKKALKEVFSRRAESSCLLVTYC